MKWLVLISITLLGYSSNAAAAKKQCAELLTKLHNIQAQQRQGQSLKNSNKLRSKEDLARERWWDCENNKTTAKTKKKKKRTAKKLKNEIKVVKRKKPAKRVKQEFSSNKLVIKGKYSGQKQVQWLAFYKRPKKCARPKTTQVFAYCMEYKEKQQQVFEKQYQNN